MLRVDMLEFQICKLLVDRVFLGVRGDADRSDRALGKFLLDFVANVVFEASHDEALPHEVLRFVVLPIGKHRRVEHVDQAREALGSAVVGRGRKHDEGVRALREKARQLRALAFRTALGDVVRLVDQDDVPVRFFQERAVLGALLQRIDRDDRAVDVEERVVPARNARHEALQAVAVKARQRNRETVPEFLLKLLEHRLDSKNENSLPATARDQFGDENPRFERFADTDRVGNQDAGTRGGERFDGGLQLIGKDVHRGLLCDVHLGVRRGRAPQERLDEELRLHEALRRVRHEVRFLGAQDRDAVFVLDEEFALLTAHDVGNPRAGEFHETFGALPLGALDALDEPLGVSDDDAHPGGEFVLHLLFLLRRARGTVPGRRCERILPTNHARHLKSKETTSRSKK